MRLSGRNREREREREREEPNPSPSSEIHSKSQLDLFLSNAQVLERVREMMKEEAKATPEELITLTCMKKTLETHSSKWEERNTEITQHKTHTHKQASVQIPQIPFLFLNL